MEIKLPHMPFKFDSPEGRIEITVRRGATLSGTPPTLQFGAAATFLQPGARALERIPLAAKANTYTGVMQALTEGFKINPDAYAKDTPEYRVLTALCTATGVVDVND